MAWPEPVQEGGWQAEEIKEGVGLMGVTGEEVGPAEEQGRGRADGCDW